MEFGRSAYALIKPRVRFPAQLSTSAAVQARNEYSQSANRRKCFTKTEPEGVKGKQALFTRRQTAAAAQHSPEEAETRASSQRQPCCCTASPQSLPWHRPAGVEPLGGRRPLPSSMSPSMTRSDSMCLPHLWEGGFVGTRQTGPDQMASLRLSACWGILAPAWVPPSLLRECICLCHLGQVTPSWYPSLFPPVKNKVRNTPGCLPVVLINLKP